MYKTDAPTAAEAPVSTLKETDKAYAYTVGEGDSYTTLARRAVAALDDKLTPAERVAAETKLTNDAQMAELAVGQQVELTKDSVRAAIDWAKKLDDGQKAAWQPYADMIAW